MSRRKYSREKLYKEVWQEPVRKVAERYGVSDVAIHKICKSMNIPTPPRGYWNKVAVGVVLKKKPLPKNTQKTFIMGYYSEPVDEQTKNVMNSKLEFLNSEEKKEVVSVCSNLDIYKKDHFCSLVASHKKRVLEWNKNHPLEYGREVIQDRWGRAKKPLAAREVSEKQLDRVFKILDVLCWSLLHLGCKILPDLSFEIRGGKAKIEIFEMQERRPHTLTESEQKQLQKYREEQEEYEIRKKLGHSVYLGTEPTFKEYDYIFNGRLRLTVGERKRFFEDEKEKHRIENRIGEVIVALYEQAELSRLEREKKNRKRN